MAKDKMIDRYYTDTAIYSIPIYYILTTKITNKEKLHLLEHIYEYI